MAAISALAAYGSDSSENEASDDDSGTITEDHLLHLKPLDKAQLPSSVVKTVAVAAAPVVAVKVSKLAINKRQKTSPMRERCCE